MVAQTKEDILSILRQQLPHLTSHYGVKQIGIFGSFAHDQQHSESDVDVIVEFERPLGLRFVELADELEKLLGRRTDVLTLEGIRGIRNAEISAAIQGSIVYV